MTFEELQKTWQFQNRATKVSVDADLLLKEVRRNQRGFRTTIFWRDVREVTVAFLLTVFFSYHGLRHDDWAAYLLAFGCFGVGAFMLADRARQRRKKPAPSDPLKACIETSLDQVNHQIWLLRNIVWWYLLPLALPLVIFFGRSAWRTGRSAVEVTVTFGAAVGFVVLLDWGIYWLNQYCVRKQLQPRQRELESLLANLENTPPPVYQPIEDQPPVRKSISRVWLWVTISFCAVAAIAVVVGQVAGRWQRGAFNQGLCPAAGDAAVTNILVRVQQKHRMPAIAAAVVTSKGLATVGVAGLRKNGTSIPVTLDDKWHLGSDGKAMTAVLVAQLVEQGQLKWDTTVSEVFPELASRLHSDAARITVMQLLTHRSGLRPNPNLRDYLGKDGAKERLRLVTNELSKRPSHSPGTHYEYSNLGYSIAGAITEKVTGRSWEELMRARVFEPLGITSAGFGGTGTDGEIDQPWGHTAQGKPVSGNGPAMDNPPVLGPAGRIHCTIQDWAKFLADQLRGARGQPALLKPESYRILHTPAAGGDYALGWAVRERPWGGGTVFQHTGDNTMNFANVWLAPRRDFAVLACLNQTGNQAFLASDDAISSLIKLHLQRTNTTDAALPPKR